jgi:ATP-dependent Clp protease adaptor protein ClpS
MSTATDIVLDEKITVTDKEPNKYKIVFLNDDTTPMEFVIELLLTIYNYTENRAVEITQKIHEEGSGVVGVYTHEVAEQKSIETVNTVKHNGFQLQVKLEEE